MATSYTASGWLVEFGRQVGGGETAAIPRLDEDAVEMGARRGGGNGELGAGRDAGAHVHTDRQYRGKSRRRGSSSCEQPASEILEILVLIEQIRPCQLVEIIW